MVLLSVLSRNHPVSLPAKAAGYAYIAQFAAICRVQHLPPEHSEKLCISTRSQWSGSSRPVCHVMPLLIPLMPSDTGIAIR